MKSATLVSKMGTCLIISQVYFGLNADDAYKSRHISIIA